MEQIQFVGGYNRHQVFDDFLDLSLNALQRDDENYLDVMDTYGEEEAQLYSEALGELMKASAEANHDVLGVVYEELGNSSDHFGQHFTPHNLSDMKASMVIDEDPDEDRDEPYSVMDPAAGSGRLLISAAKQLPAGEAEFYAVDKDSTCAKMAALNLCFFNMDGYVVHGDSLTQDYHTVWATEGSALGGSVYELDDDQWTNPYNAVVEEPEDEVEESENSGEQEQAETPDVDFEELRDTTLSEFSDGGGCSE
ncbi:N-6 DNA methylase [Natronomonas gomsonensis]|uniref:N-6 DNA methylase n=1 Tax=Natronomonas gomsonensis TaxID=1046043 RepID=UPI0020CA2A90|nr:N-6 DNA methylase [Natronomonas gomsonensis]MCY4730526.1 N-6 DNA methylase [Natronomonas gomsonensis]